MLAVFVVCRVPPTIVHQSLFDRGGLSPGIAGSRGFKKVISEKLGNVFLAAVFHCV